MIPKRMYAPEDYAGVQLLVSNSLKTSNQNLALPPFAGAIILVTTFHIFRLHSHKPAFSRRTFLLHSQEVMIVKKKRDFDPNTFLATIGEGRKIVSFQTKQTVFEQGDPADAVFYIQKGKVKLTVVSSNGKEATIGILRDSAFFVKGASQASRSAWLLQLQ